MHFLKKKILLTILSVVFVSTAAQSGIVTSIVVGAVVGSVARHVVDKNLNGTSTVSPNSVQSTVPKVPSIEVGFSPEGTSEPLIIKLINASTRSVLLSASIFDSVSISSALLSAKQRGVDVRVIVDQKMNIDEDKVGKSRVALTALARAGIPTRIVNYYPVNHDNYIIVDRAHVATGSYNYSSPASVNSENVMVAWYSGVTAEAYLEKWSDRFSKGTDYRTGF
jgi:phosphatidylserine/phosphatidylglycerophosphate/cardiolipin synthase-like enzyme